MFRLACPPGDHQASPPAARHELAGLVGYSSDWLAHRGRAAGVSIPVLLRVDDLSVLIDGDTPIQRSILHVIAGRP